MRSYTAIGINLKVKFLTTKKRFVDFCIAPTRGIESYCFIVEYALPQQVSVKLSSFNDVIIHIASIPLFDVH